MSGDWQTWAALTVVAATAAVMVYRGFIRKNSGCATGCGCAKPQLTGRASRKEQKPS